jgi:ubiquinone/menaquinone biosynthesis C-methylase UbiE
MAGLCPDPSLCTAVEAQVTKKGVGRLNDIKEWKRYYLEEYSKFWIPQSQQYEKDRSYQTYYTILLDLIGANSSQHVLDCGVGTGKPLALALAKLGAVMYGLDISPPLVQECLANFKKEGLTINCQVGDLENLPYSDEVFDVVYSINTTWYVPDLKKALTEMCRVTKSGGKIVFDVINLLHPSQFLNYWYSKLARTQFFATMRKLKRRLQGKSADDLTSIGPWEARSPQYIGRILRELKLRYQVKGFFVLLPLSLPLLGERVNLCKYSKWFSFGLQDHSLLKYFGGKLVYIC